MKDRKVRKRYISKWYVVRISLKDSPSKFLADYFFFRSKRQADTCYNDTKRSVWGYTKDVKRFTIKTSKSTELNRFLRNVENAVTIAKDRVGAVTTITYLGLEK